jgi:hypothetical protein
MAAAAQCTPPPEECNGVDDDCDGATDENLVRDCSNVCGAGTQTCTFGFWGTCSAPAGTAEVCDADDDDCDGLIDDGPGVCGPCTVVTLTGAAVPRAYMFCPVATAWATAQAQCSARGYHLVAINNSTENDGIINRARMASDTDWWIGLNDVTTEDTFVWDGGSTSTYRNFNPTGEPAAPGPDLQDCVYIGNGTGEPLGTWADVRCDNVALPFVCETP